MEVHFLAYECPIAPEPFVGKTLHPALNVLLHLCKKTFECTCVGLFWGSLLIDPLLICRDGPSKSMLKITSGVGPGKLDLSMKQPYKDI